MDLRVSFHAASCGRIPICILNRCSILALRSDAKLFRSARLHFSLLFCRRGYWVCTWQKRGCIFGSVRLIPCGGISICLLNRCSILAGGSDAKLVLRQPSGSSPFSLFLYRLLDPTTFISDHLRFWLTTTALHPVSSRLGCGGVDGASAIGMKISRSENTHNTVFRLVLCVFVGIPY